MKTATFDTSITQTGFTNWLAEKVKILMARQRKAVASENQNSISDEQEQVAELLDRIEQGYIVEETGEVAKLPRFALKQLSANVKSEGWA